MTLVENRVVSAVIYKKGTTEVSQVQLFNAGKTPSIVEVGKTTQIINGLADDGSNPIQEGDIVDIEYQESISTPSLEESAKVRYTEVSFVRVVRRK